MVVVISCCSLFECLWYAASFLVVKTKVLCNLVEDSICGASALPFYPYADWYCASKRLGLTLSCSSYGGLSLSMVSVWSVFIVDVQCFVSVISDVYIVVVKNVNFVNDIMELNFEFYFETVANSAPSVKLTQQL